MRGARASLDKETTNATITSYSGLFPTQLIGPRSARSVLEYYGATRQASSFIAIVEPLFHFYPFMLNKIVDQILYNYVYLPVYVN
jgi:hypothetical protein